MNTAVRYEFAALTSQLGEMCAMAADAMNHATHALLLADLEMAEIVIGGRDGAAAMSSSAEETTFLLLALQPPVAADLRAVVNAVRVVADADQMGELAVRVAEIARRHHPNHAVPAEVSGRVAEMSAMAVALACAAQEVLLSREPHLAAHLRRNDGAIDALHRQLLAVLVDTGWAHGANVGVEVGVISHLYEQFAHHAMDISRRFIFQTNGDRGQRGAQTANGKRVFSTFTHPVSG